MAEKMLTNWFTFLLYKFLKVGRPRGPNEWREGLAWGGSREGTEAKA